MLRFYIECDVPVPNTFERLVKLPFRVPLGTAAMGGAAGVKRNRWLDSIAFCPAGRAPYGAHGDVRGGRGRVLCAEYLLQKAREAFVSRLKWHCSALHCASQ